MRAHFVHTSCALSPTHVRCCGEEKVKNFPFFPELCVKLFLQSAKHFHVTSRIAYPSAYSESTLTHIHTHSAFLFLFSPSFALHTVRSKKAQLHSRRCRNAKIIRPFDSHVESQLYLESMLSPRDLDLLLVRSCSLSFSRLLSCTPQLLRPLKRDLTNTTSVSLAHQHTVGSCALGLMQSKHLRNCTFYQHFWPHFHHFYRLQTVITEQSRVRFDASRPHFTTDTNRISTVEHTHLHTRTRL